LFRYELSDEAAVALANALLLDLGLLLPADTDDQQEPPRLLISAEMIRAGRERLLSEEQQQLPTLTKGLTSEDEAEVDRVPVNGEARFSVDEEEDNDKDRPRGQ
jgi:hypothetical protein